MAGPATTLVVTLSGRDRPGLVAGLFTAIAPHDLSVLDVEQVVIRGHLVLGLLLGAAQAGAQLDADAVTRTVQQTADRLGLSVEVAPGGADREERGSERSHVTVLGVPLRAAGLAGLSTRIAAVGANIDRVVRLARRPVTGVELEVSGTPTSTLRPLLAAEAAAQGIDVAVERAGLHRRAKRLVVMDVDSTLIRGEVIELLAAEAGRLAEVERITGAAMRGELDFASSLRARVRLLTGLEAQAIERVRASIELAPGARTLVRTLKRLDHRFAIVSGGFTQVTDGLAADLGIDYAAANTLELRDGRLTGELVGPILDRAGKAAALRRFAADAGIPLSQTVAIGDGANDLDMLAVAGLGIAFNAKPAVRAAADTTVTVPYLDAILHLLGISRAEVEGADSEAAPGSG